MACDLNIELLRKVKQRFAEHGVKTDHPFQEMIDTVCDVAGVYRSQVQALTALNIKDGDDLPLFYHSVWPKRLFEDWMDRPHLRTQTICAAIDAYIERMTKNAE